MDSNYSYRSGLSLQVGKGSLLGTPSREPQEYSRSIVGIYLRGSLYSIIFLLKFLRFSVGRSQ